MYADLALRLPSTSARWRSPEFRAELTAWVGESVGSPHSLEPVQDRPWSTVWRVTSDAGVCFAKQNTPLQSFEAALMAELSRIAPDYVVPVVAIDLERGLLLTPGQGAVLGETVGDLGEDERIELATRVVTAGAELQREVAPQVDRLTAAGLEPLLPAEMVGYVEKRLDDFATLSSDDARALAGAQRRQLQARIPELARRADQVAALALPPTLVHNDLHQHNVFDVGGRLRFFDFGDALLSDPLAALWVPLAGLARDLECEIDDARIRRVADAALEIWSDVAPLDDLRAALPAGLSLGRLGRCESWIRCMPSMTDAELGEYGDAAAYWLGAVAD